MRLVIATIMNIKSHFKFLGLNIKVHINSIMMIEKATMINIKADKKKIAINPHVAITGLNTSHQDKDGM